MRGFFSEGCDEDEEIFWERGEDKKKGVVETWLEWSGRKVRRSLILFSRVGLMEEALQLAGKGPEGGKGGNPLRIAAGL